jgi:hypothetical protein
MPHNPLPARSDFRARGSPIVLLNSPHASRSLNPVFPLVKWMRDSTNGMSTQRTYMNHDGRSTALPAKVLVADPGHRLPQNAVSWENFTTKLVVSMAG